MLRVERPSVSADVNVHIRPCAFLLCKLDHMSRSLGAGVTERVKWVRLDEEGEREKVSHDVFHPAQDGRKAIRVSRPGL